MQPTELLILFLMNDKLAWTFHISIWISMHTQHAMHSMLNFPMD